MSENINVFKTLKKILGSNLLISLLNVSRQELKDYIANPKLVPETILRRLAFLIEVMDILRGGYNDLGMRQWFLRKRVDLGGRSPKKILRGDWNPEDSGSRLVLELARGIDR